MYSPGDTVQLNDTRQATIIKMIGRGGQGVVYEVDYKGDRAALKILHKAKSEAEYTRHLALRASLVGSGSWPGLMNINLDKRFLVPRRIFVIGNNDQLALLMPLRNPKFVELKELLADKVKIPKSVSALTVLNRLCFELSDTIATLHKSGLVFRDLNPGAIGLCLKTGRIRLCDTDLISPEGETGLDVAYPDLLPPEVLRRERRLSQSSDLYTLSVVLFQIWCRIHPLKGERFINPIPLSDQERYRALAEDPVFVFDPKDQGNALSPQRHKRQIDNWARLSYGLQELFTHAFTRGLVHAEERLLAAGWRDYFLEQLDTIVTCCACNRPFTLDMRRCPRCGDKPLPQKHIIVTDQRGNHRRINWSSHMFLCEAHLCESGSSKRIGVARTHEFQHGESPWALKNLSDSTWSVSSREQRAVRSVPPGELLYFRSGLTVHASRPSLSFELRGDDH